MPTASRSKLAAAAAVLCCLALGARLLHVRSILRDPLGGILVQDARYYHSEALRIVESRPAREGASFMNLGYPYLLAATYAVFGPHPSAVVWLQAALGVLTAGLVACAAAYMLDSAGAALLAGGLYAFYGPAFFYEGVLLIPAAANLLVAAALACVVAGRRSGSFGAHATAGAAIGLAALLRGSALLYVPVLALVVAFSGPGGRERVRRAGAFVLAALAVVLPVILGSVVRNGRWTPITANAGMNFWVGNHASSEGVYYAADFVSEVDARGEQEGFLTEARRRTGRSDLDLVEADRYWLVEGLRDIRDHFGRWLRIEGRKLALFWNQHETRTNVGMEFHAQFSPVLRLLPGFGVLAVLGLAGLTWLIVAGPHEPALVLAAFLFVPMATCLLFFVSGEYRHPAAVALSVAAAAAVDGFVRRGRAGIVPAAVGMLALPLVLHRFPPLERTDHPRLDYANHARALCADEAAGPSRFERAVDLLQHGEKILGEDPFLLDALLQVRLTAARSLDDGEQAARALEVAERLAARVGRLEPGDCPERFVLEALARLERSVAVLGRLPSVREDPVSSRRAQALARRLAPLPEIR